MTWTRRGECNHCGFCCLFLATEPHILSFNKDGIRNKEGGFDAAHAQVRGLVEQPDGTMAVPAWFYSPCTAFDTKELRCGIQETKPDVCKDYPWLPSQVIGTPCSYYFEKVTPGSDKVLRTLRQGGQASPFPGRTVQMGAKVFEDASDYFNIPYPLITTHSLMEAYRVKTTQGMETSERGRSADQGHGNGAHSEFDPFAAEDDTRL